MIALSISIAIAAIAAWDIARRWLARERASDRSQLESRLAAIDDLAKRMDKLESVQALIRASQQGPRRPHLSGIGK